MLHVYEVSEIFVNKQYIKKFLLSLEIGYNISNIQARQQKERDLIYPKFLEMLVTSLKSHQVLVHCLESLSLTLGQNMQVLLFSKPLTVSVTEIHRAECWNQKELNTFLCAPLSRGLHQQGCVLYISVFKMFTYLLLPSLQNSWGGFWRGEGMQKLWYSTRPEEGRS